MLKYIDANIVFQEVPDEISLAISITNCPNHCPDCHSKYLWEDTGKLLTDEELDSHISKYADDITCVCFMGGDRDKHEVYRLAGYVREKYPKLKIAWYTGQDEIDHDFIWENFDYVKVGRFIKIKGGLDNPNSNQYMIKREGNHWIDISDKFYALKHVI